MPKTVSTSNPTTSPSKGANGTSTAAPIIIEPSQKTSGSAQNSSTGSTTGRQSLDGSADSNNNDQDSISSSNRRRKGGAQHSRNSGGGSRASSIKSVSSRDGRHDEIVGDRDADRARNSAWGLGDEARMGLG
jgi:hypothetical protein